MNRVIWLHKWLEIHKFYNELCKIPLSITLKPQKNSAMFYNLLRIDMDGFGKILNKNNFLSLAWQLL